MEEDLKKFVAIDCPICGSKIELLNPMPVFDIGEYHSDMLITHEMEYLARKKLEEENKELKEKFVPKSVIEEKIEELDIIINKIKQYGHTNRLHELRVKRKTLQELLEKGDS